MKTLAALLLEIITTQIKAFLLRKNSRKDYSSSVQPWAGFSKYKQKQMTWVLAVTKLTVETKFHQKQNKLFIRSPNKTRLSSKILLPLSTSSYRHQVPENTRSMESHMNNWQNQRRKTGSLGLQSVDLFSCLIYKHQRLDSTLSRVN